MSESSSAGHEIVEVLGCADSPRCGDVVRVELGINAQRVIVRTGYRVFGCGSAMERTASTLRAITGMTVDEARAVAAQAIGEEDPDEGSEGCAAAERAVLAALDEYLTNGSSPDAT